MAKLGKELAVKLVLGAAGVEVNLQGGDAWLPRYFLNAGESALQQSGVVVMRVKLRCGFDADDSCFLDAERKHSGLTPALNAGACG